MINETYDPPKQTAIRLVCECGGSLGTVTIPAEATFFHAICPGCGTNYRREMAALASRSRPGEIVTVILPRSRPRG